MSHMDGPKSSYQDDYLYSFSSLPSQQTNRHTDVAKSSKGKPSQLNEQKPPELPPREFAENKKNKGKIFPKSLQIGAKEDSKPQKKSHNNFDRNDDSGMQFIKYLNPVKSDLNELRFFFNGKT